MNKKFNIDIAKKLDRRDSLRHFRNAFNIPKFGKQEAIYFTGHSLGLQPKQHNFYLNQELEDWKLMGVEGHFDAKTAHKMIKENGKLEDVKQIQEQLKQIDFNAIRKIFLEPETTNVDKIEFNEIRYDDIINYMSNERSFSRDRVNSSLNRLKKNLEKKSQTLEKWF